MHHVIVFYITNPFGLEVERVDTLRMLTVSVPKEPTRSAVQRAVPKDTQVLTVFDRQTPWAD